MAGEQTNPIPGKPFFIPDAAPAAGTLISVDAVTPTSGKIEPGSFSPPIGEASVIPYTPSTPGNWPSPTPGTVAQALDDLSAGGSEGALTAHTVLGGVTYAMTATDREIIADSSNGSQPVIQMTQPASGWEIGETFDFSWFAWDTGVGQPVGPEIIAPAGVKMVPYDGQSVSGVGGLVSSTVVTTPGDTMSLRWNGTFLAQV